MTLIEQQKWDIVGIYQAISPSQLLATSVPVTGGSGPVGPIFANVASITLDKINIGDILLVTMDIETSQGSFITYNTDLTTQVVAGPTVGASNQFVIRASGMNNTENNHHLVTSRSCHWLVTVPQYNILTLMIAADSDVAGTSDIYTIESLTGQVILSAMQLTPKRI